MIDMEPHPQGTILPVRAHAGARRNALDGVQNGMLRVAVTQAPEKGKANRAIVEVISRALDIRKSQFVLLSGETSREKRFLVQNVSPEELSAAIARTVPS